MTYAQAQEYVLWHKNFGVVARLIDMEPMDFKQRLWRGRAHFSELEKAAIAYAVTWFVKPFKVYE